jgi:hypothetical protein
MFKSSIKITFLTVLFFCVYSCKKDKQEVPNEPSPLTNSTKTINGAVQKGPYKSGAPIAVYELNSSLGQTGKSFATTINDNAGNFSLNNISLSSNHVLITASGYYFNEHFNQTSEGQLYLEAFADVSSASTVNVNLLTHILKPRIEQLIFNSLDFNTARIQAQNEFLTIVGATGNVNSNFESLNLSNNGFLFAMSLLFQRNNSSGYQVNYNYTAELSALLSNFRNDFANNGLIDNQSLIDTLVYNAKRIDLIDCPFDTQTYYSGLGSSFSAPGFETHLYNFQKKYTTASGTHILYPATASIMIDAPMVAPPYDYRENLLEINKTHFSVPSHQYVVSAIVPYDSTLVVKFTPYTTGPFSFSNQGGGNFGWKLTQSGGSYIYEAQRKNVVLSAFINPANDSVKVEYFKNPSSLLPYYVKTVVF